MLKRLWLLFTFTSAFLSLNASAQPVSQRPVNELKLQLNNDGSHYIKATFVNQVWVRYTENNPGTTLDGALVNNTFDIGLRRTRLQLFGKLNDKVFFHIQMGQNNMTFNGARKQGIFFHDAVGELEFIPRYLSVGAGLSGWSGLSRYASPAVSTTLALDVPLYQQATGEISDQFLRKYSVYAKGKIEKLDYRVALSKPMTIKNNPVQSTEIDTNSLFSARPPRLQLQGYFMYQFRDEESNATAYNAGTYLGKKNILNIGAGFITQKDAMWHSNNGDTAYENMQLLALDVFFEKVLNKSKQNALTVYACLSHTNFGKNYLRNVAVMNASNGTNAQASFNASGNGFPMIGTGNTFYTQAGYLFPRNMLRSWGTLQPYASTQVSRFERLRQNMHMHELGVNWLISNQNARLSAGYQSRPVFAYNSASELTVAERKGMYVAQLQVGF